MALRWLGAILVIVGSGGIGLSMAMHYKKQEQTLRQLVKALDIFLCELEYRLTPLPAICRTIAESVDGNISKVFSVLATELESQICPDAFTCMDAALVTVPEIAEKPKNILHQLGQTLGCYDVAGQISELNAAKGECTAELERIRGERDVRIRNYQTLGFCAGVALAILLI